LIGIDRDALAAGYAPASLSENADGIRQDWPRVPLPDSREALEHSARLGREEGAQGSVCQQLEVVEVSPQSVL
jgi:hypothetical protein